MLLEQTEIMRKVFFISSCVTALGPYALYHVYTGWLIIDAIVAPAGTYTIVRSALKIVSFIVYTILAVFVVTELLPEIYNYWLELWVVGYVAARKEAWEASGGEEGTEEDSFVSPDERPLSDLIGTLF